MAKMVNKTEVCFGKHWRTCNRYRQTERRRQTDGENFPNHKVQCDSLSPSGGWAGTARHPIPVSCKMNVGQTPGEHALPPVN